MRALGIKQIQHQVYRAVPISCFLAPFDLPRFLLFPVLRFVLIVHVSSPWLDNTGLERIDSSVSLWLDFHMSSVLHVVPRVANSTATD